MSVEVWSDLCDHEMEEDIADTLLTCEELNVQDMIPQQKFWWNGSEKAIAELGLSNTPRNSMKGFVGFICNTTYA